MSLNSLYGLSFSGSTLYHIYDECKIFLNENKETALSISETLFYNTATPSSKRMGELLRFIHSLALNNFTYLQMAFAIFNGGLAVHSSRQIATAAGRSSLGIFPAISLTAISIYINRLIFIKVMQYRKEANPVQSQVLFKSEPQILSAALQLTNMMQSVALGILSKNKISHLVRAAMNGYSLHKNNRFNWINCKGSIRTPQESIKIDQPRITRIDAQYDALVYSNVIQSKDCTICTEANADQVFCSQGHVYHSECLQELFTSVRGDDVQPGSMYKADFTRYDNEVYMKGVHRRTEYSYGVKIREENLPGCPNCRERPQRNSLKLTVHDLDKGIFSARVDIIKKNNSNGLQSIFEKLYAIYSVFRGILGLLQQIPDFTQGTTKLRRVMVVSDIIMGGLANYYLIQNTKSSEKGECRQVVGIIALITVPVLIGLASLFRPRSDLSLLNLNDVTAEWKRPLSEHIHYILDAYCLVTTLALTYFSKTKKIVNMTSIIGQITALVGAMNVHWLRVERQTGINFHTYMILPHALSTNSETVKKAVDFLANLQQRIIIEGNKYFINWYENGALVKKTVKINYSIKKIRDIQEHVFRPFIWTWDGLNGMYENFDLTIDLGN